MAQVTLKICLTGISDNGDGTFTVKQETRTPEGRVIREHETRFVAYRGENGSVTAETLEFGKPIPGNIQSETLVPFKEIEALWLERMGRVENADK